MTLKNLKLGWGSSFGAGLDVLGSSHITLDNTDLVHNNGASGGGIYIGGGSQVTLTNGSLVQYNTGSAGGGAIVYGRLNSLDNSSDITGNCSTTDGGGAYVSGGTLYLSNADVHANQALGATGRGGAIFASGDAVDHHDHVQFHRRERAVLQRRLRWRRHLRQSLAHLLAGRQQHHLAESGHQQRRRPVPVRWQSVQSGQRDQRRLRCSSRQRQSGDPGRGPVRRYQRPGLRGPHRQQRRLEFGRRPVCQRRA